MILVTGLIRHDGGPSKFRILFTYRSEHVPNLGDCIRNISEQSGLTYRVTQVLHIISKSGNSDVLRQVDLVLEPL